MREPAKFAERTATTELPRRVVLRRALAGSAAAAAGTIRRARAQANLALTMAVWAGPAEEQAFRAVIARYQQAHPTVTVRLQVNGSSQQLYQQIDTRLAGRQAPDLFRAQYQQIGRYASAGALVDLTPYLGAGYGAQFAPAFWQAVNYHGHPFALPHHTDTFALYYNVEYFKEIGVEAPTSLDKCLTWAELARIARLLKQKAGLRYGFAMGWQLSAAYRWLPFLYQHGGALLDPSLRQPQLETKAGIETIAWTQSWFKDGLVPPGTSIKSSEATQALFANGTIGMLLHGDWWIPFLQTNMTRWRWNVTFMPRDAAMASDLGGNCVAVTRDSKHPEVAADFLQFLVNEANMRDFITTAQFLPVRVDLMGQKLAYANRPDAMQVFIEQATTVPPAMVRVETLPRFSRINATLADQLDLAFTSGQSPTATARQIDAKIRTILAD